MGAGNDLILSVIIPVFNEAESIPSLAAEVSAMFGKTGIHGECLWVNDASTDNTMQVLQSLAKADSRHRCVDLRQRFGQSAALAAGFSVARGNILATLDGDGQNDPEDLPLMLAELEKQGVDLMNGIRQKRRDTIVRRLCSKIANGFRNAITRETVTDVGCAIRVFRRDCVRAIPVFKGMHRFLPTLIRLQGFRIAEMPVRHRPREKGRTKYGINNRLWVGLADTLAVCWMQRRLVWPEVKQNENREIANP